MKFKVRTTGMTDLAKALREVIWVQECVFEKIEIKREIFKENYGRQRVGGCKIKRPALPLTNRGKRPALLTSVDPSSPEGSRKATMSKSIAVVGAGLVGRGWAIVFARAGHPVQLFDVTEEKISEALQTIEKNLADLASHGLISNPNEIRERITGTPDLADAL